MFRKTKHLYGITIPDPCAEDWNKMTPVGQGRFCAACQRNLVDFSILSDEEIIKTLKNNNGKICGLFAKDQLNRPLQEPTVAFRIPAPISRIQKIAASLLVFYSFLNQASAQQKPATATHLSVNNNSPVHKIQNPLDTAAIVIKGKLVDYHSGEAVKKLEIEIEGTGIKTSTNKYGQFKFLLPDSFLGHRLTIKASKAGQLFLDTTASIIPPQYVYINSLPFREEITMQRYPIDTLPNLVIETPMQRASDHYGGIPMDVVYSYPTPQPKHLTIWQKFKAFFKSKKKKGSL